MRRAAAVLLFAVFCAGRVVAHEIGKTQVATWLHDGVYQIDVTVDPDALLPTLEVFGARELWRGSGREERDRRIAELASVFLDRVRVSFDGRQVEPELEYRPATAFADAARTPSLVRLRGAIPAGSTTFAFGYGLALGTYAITVRIDDGPVQTQWLVAEQATSDISLANPPAALSRAQVAAQYFTLGFSHIVPHGLDHVLFVLGIFLLTPRWRSIVAQVSAFTLAHSITLGLTMYGIVSLPARVIEPMIALSIVYVAIENLVLSELKPWRLALVFSFGLLHGMGFAGVLRDLGLPRPAYLTALVTFNAGVEGGQLLVIALAFALCAYWQRNRVSYRRFVVQPASLVIAGLGLFWTIQRALL